MYKVFFENWEGYFLEETFETYEEAIKYAEKELEECNEEEDMLILHNNKVIWEDGVERR